MRKSDRSKIELEAEREIRAGDAPVNPSLRSPLPASDETYPFISGILAAVPFSRWSLARVAASGELSSLHGFPPEGPGLRELALEFDLQRAKAPTGPRVAATLGSLDAMESGVTLLFADDQTDFGILTLARSAELGPFTSSEISMLTFAVNYGSERGANHRLQPFAQNRDTFDATVTTPAKHALDGAFYILDSDLQIVLSWDAETTTRLADTFVEPQMKQRLPMVLEDTVRTLTASWWSGGAQYKRGIAKLVTFLVVRTYPMLGPGGLFVGVRVNPSPSANSLTAVAAKYRISPREVQVLALLLDGNHLDEVGKQLFITPSTVQDHIKSMLEKTKSRNRTELVARVLGWVMQGGTKQSSSSEPVSV